MNFVAWMIVACEIMFWIVIVLGLVTRYVFNRKKLGLFLMALTPVIDLILLIITTFDLYRGATATVSHGIAAVYIGISIGFGKSMIDWADKRFLFYVKKEGTKPVVLSGMDYALHYLKGFSKHILSFLLGAGLIIMMMILIKDTTRTEALLDVIKIWALVLGIDFLFTISYFIWPKKKKTKIMF